MWSRNCLSFRITWIQPQLLVGVGGRVYLSLVFCVMFCRSLLVLLGLFLLSMDCLSFFDLRFLIIPTVSSNFSSESLVSDWLKVPVQMIFTSYKWCSSHTKVSKFNLMVHVLCMRLYICLNTFRFRLCGSYSFSNYNYIRVYGCVA